MFSFKNDYSEGAHPRIIEALAKSNLEQTDGYGCDPHTERAAQLIKAEIGRQGVDVHLLAGGTQTNLTLIAAALRPYQAVIAAQTAHVCVHETGAVEATGHKVIAMPSQDGRLAPALIQEAVDAHPDEHMVQPRLVYISQSSELGTIYKKADLEEIRRVCDRNGLYLFVDGARLASALTAQESDVTIADLARLTDAFYIGGTKNGALFGEALVIANDALKTDFRYSIKQRGGMLAKGRMLGIQFECLFADGLYWELGRHANKMAMLLKQAFLDAEFKMLTDSPTNQQFVILPDSLVKKLEKNYKFEVYGAMGGGMTAVRFVTSWATPEAEVHGFIEYFRGLC